MLQNKVTCNKYLENVSDRNICEQLSTNINEAGHEIVRTGRINFLLGCEDL
jgi:hypothetical protein